MDTEPSIFTRIINGDIPGYIPYQNETVAVLVSLEGHLLIVPKIHYENIYELPEAVGSEMMCVAIMMSRILKKVTQCDGINLIQSNGSAAGQDVFHIHLHLKPRYQNDNTVLHWDTSTVPAAERDRLATLIQAEL